MSVGREISRPASSGGGAPPRPARVSLWCPVVPPFVQSPTARNGPNDLTRVHKFGELFYGFRSSRGVLEARVSFGITSYVYTGPRVAYG